MKPDDRASGEGLSGGRAPPWLLPIDTSLGAEDQHSLQNSPANSTSSDGLWLRSPAISPTTSLQGEHSACHFDFENLFENGPDGDPAYGGNSILQLQQQQLQLQHQLYLQQSSSLSTNENDPSLQPADNLPIKLELTIENETGTSDLDAPRFKRKRSSETNRGCDNSDNTTGRRNSSSSRGSKSSSTSTSGSSSTTYQAGVYPINVNTRARGVRSRSRSYTPSGVLVSKASESNNISPTAQLSNNRRRSSTSSITALAANMSTSGDHSNASRCRQRSTPTAVRANVRAPTSAQKKNSAGYHGIKTKTCMDIFKQYAVPRPDGTVDAEGIISRGCYSQWLRTRKTELKNPHLTFVQTIRGHITGDPKVGRNPFDAETEADLLKLLSKKRIWPCFVGTEAKYGSRGMKLSGYHETLERSGHHEKLERQRRTKQQGQQQQLRQQQQQQQSRSVYKNAPYTERPPYSEYQRPAQKKVQAGPVPRSAIQVPFKFEQEQPQEQVLSLMQVNSNYHRQRLEQQQQLQQQQQQQQQQDNNQEWQTLAARNRFFTNGITNANLSQSLPSSSTITAQQQQQIAATYANLVKSSRPGEVDFGDAAMNMLLPKD